MRRSISCNAVAIGSCPRIERWVSVRIIDEFPRLARVVMSRCRSSVMDLLGYEMDLDFCLIV